MVQFETWSLCEVRKTRAWSTVNFIVLFACKRDRESERERKEKRVKRDIRGITFRSRSLSLRHSRLLTGRRASSFYATWTPYTARKRLLTLVKYDVYLLIRSKLYPHYPARFCRCRLSLSLSLSSPFYLLLPPPLVDSFSSCLIPIWLERAD